MTLATLVFVSPDTSALRGLPNRPKMLLAALVAARTFREINVVNRVRPATFARHVRRGAPMLRGGLLGIRRRLPDGTTLIEHPWPFGALERRFLRALVRGLAGQSPDSTVVWVADPKSVSGVTRGRNPAPWRVVFDAYDAWDRSPLVRGRRRQRAVREGYRAAAARADVVFANTVAMHDRLRSLGAARVVLLPNACPPVDPVSDRVAVRGTGLIYVGRIHERFDADLALAVTSALPGTTLTIAGPVERQPAGWETLVAQPNVRLCGPVPSGEARSMIAASAALVVLHRVDDYTRSQDAMKAWDAIASGTPVISTPIPPASDWPAGLAEVCADAAGFIAAARRAVDGDLASGRPARLAFARANQWSSRAALAIEAIEGAVARPVSPGR
jgi:glycosyltransferase involved in cell wall biosynthesis